MTEIIYYTFPLIKTELNTSGVEKKIPMHMPKWRNINKENCKENINPAHKCRANLTCNMSGITVIDHDDITSYNRMVEEYPDLIKHKTNQTRKGVHIYCLYDESVKTTTNASEDYIGIDIRSNSAVISAPPTKHELLDGTTCSYTDLGGEFLPIPDIIRNNLKQNKIKIQEKPTKKIIIEKKETLKNFLLYYLQKKIQKYQKYQK